MSRFVCGFTDKQVQKLFKRYKYINKLKKYLNSRDLVDELVEKSTGNNYPDKVWTMWLQGYENAPRIVKLCIDSIKKNSNGREVIVIDNYNLSNYVNLPNYVMDKYKKGIINNAHFADIVRTLLLIKYGGTWIDSTILCSSNYTILTKYDLFLFHTYKQGGPAIISNWFISSKKQNNYLLKRILTCLYLYWKENDSVADYFIYHLFYKLLVQNDIKAKEIESKIPFITGESCKNLLRNLNAETFDEDMIKYVFSLSCIHKLTYKEDYFGYKVDIDRICERLKILERNGE